MGESLPIAVAWFLGQGGWLTSFPFGTLGQRVGASLGLNVRVFDYTEVDVAARWWTSLQGASKAPQVRYAAAGYSLGVTSATSLQEFFDVDLLVCVAASTYARANNRPVRHPQTKRSRLFYGDDVWSCAAQDGGYDVKTHVTTGNWWLASHLSLQAIPLVTNGMLDEFAKLKGN